MSTTTESEGPDRKVLLARINRATSRGNGLRVTRFEMLAAEQLETLGLVSWVDGRVFVSTDQGLAQGES